MLWKKLRNLILFTVIFLCKGEKFSVSEVQLEALKSGGFRVYVYGSQNVSHSFFTANINKSIRDSIWGEIIGNTTAPFGNFRVYEFNNRLKLGDVVNYWTGTTFHGLLYKKNGFLTVTELRDSYSPLNTNKCRLASTVVDEGKPTCIGQLIIEDEFNGPNVNTEKWTVQHRIPTYTGPSFEFNSYEDIDQTRFFKKGKLHLRPIALQSPDDVRGTLNLRKGCTSTDDSQCFYRQFTSFLLPPVKSAKITSKTSFKYGKVEIRAKLPQGDWIYPVIELEPKHKVENSTKLWIAYSRGNAHLTGNDNIDLGSTLLFAGPVIHPSEPVRSTKLISRRNKSSYNEKFHVYTLEWTQGKMLFFFDGELYGSVTSESGFDEPSLGIGNDWKTPQAPFDQERVLSLGVAVGGFNDFPDYYTSGTNPKPWVNWERYGVKKFFDARDLWLRSWNGDNSALKIDYVKVWAL